MPNALINNNIRKGPYTLTVTAPDGTNSTQNWAYADNSGGILSTTFVPSEVGNYVATFHYGGKRTQLYHRWFHLSRFQQQP